MGKKTWPFGVMKKSTWRRNCCRKLFQKSKNLEQSGTIRKKKIENWTMKFAMVFSFNFCSVTVDCLPFNCCQDSTKNLANL